VRRAVFASQQQHGPSGAGACAGPFTSAVRARPAEDSEDIPRSICSSPRAPLRPALNAATPRHGPRILSFPYAEDGPRILNIFPCTFEMTHGS
jgi:hypothetical protein